MGWSALYHSSLTKPVAEAVRRNDVEDPPRDPAVLFHCERGYFLVEAVILELCKQCLKVLHMKRTAVLRRVATVFREPNLDLVASKNSRFVRCVAARNHAESEHGFVERQSRDKVAHRKIHVVALVTVGFLERCCHE